MPKTRIWFLIILFLAFGALFLVSLKSSPRPVTRKSQSFLKEPPPTPTPAQKVYQNLTYGYALEYPSDWLKEEWDIAEAANLKTIPEGYIWQQLRLTKENDRFEVILWANKAQTPLLTWLTWYRHEDLPPAKLPKELNFQFLGLPALFLFQEKSPHDSHPVIRIFFQKEDKIFELIAQNPTETLEPVYQKIIESFRFL